MAQTFVEYAADGSIRDFAIPFDYISTNYVKVFVNDVETNAFSFLDTNTVRLTAAPAAGSVVKVQRDTPRDRRLVDFVDGSVLKESDLDLANTQIIHVVQEAYDNLGAEARDVIAEDKLATEGYKLAAEAARDEAVAAKDRAVTAETNAASSRTSAANSASAAAASEASAANSASSAANSAASASSSATSAASSASAAATSEGAAATSANDAAASAASASVSATDAADARDVTLGYRDTAKVYRDEAQAAAAQAQTFDPANYYTKTEVDTKDNAKLDKAGGTLTGPLVLPGNPTTDLQAAPKQYVDNKTALKIAHAHRTDGWQTHPAGSSFGFAQTVAVNTGGYAVGGAIGGVPVLHVQQAGWYRVTLNVYASADSNSRLSVIRSSNGNAVVFCQVAPTPNGDKTSSNTQYAYLHNGEHLYMNVSSAGPIALYHQLGHTDVLLEFLGA